MSKIVQIHLISIHPNLNPPPLEGPEFGKIHSAMRTYIKDFTVSIKSHYLQHSKFLSSIIKQDPRIINEGKAIEIKLTARKH